MKESHIRTMLTLIGAAVGIISGGLGVYLALVGRVESRVERETEQRVEQAVLARDLERQREQWWLMEGRMSGLSEALTGLRLQMAKQSGGE